MCLILDKDSIRTITHTDIVVYKVVNRIRGRRTKTGQPYTFYRSPYYGFDYDKDTVYCGELQESISPYSDNRTIEDGFHSYMRSEDAKIAAIDNIVIVKCIIPEGAEFYKGHGIDGTPQYASNKIAIKEEINK
jgi:hypothetical protein